MKRLLIMGALTLAWMVALAPISLLVVRTVLVSATESPFVELPGGYQLRRQSIGSAVLINLDSPDRPVWIGPGVDGYQVFPGVIAGHISCSLYGRCSVPGYFVVDTQTKTTQQGLDRQTWLRVLHGYGISQDPKLKQ